MRSGVHRLDAVVAFVAAGAFRIGLGLGLINPVAGWARGGAGDGDGRRNRGRRAVAGSRILGKNGTAEQEEKKKPFAVKPAPLNMG